MTTADVFPDHDDRGKIGGSLHFNVALRDVGAVLTALDDAGFEVELNIGRATEAAASASGVGAAQTRTEER